MGVDGVEVKGSDEDRKIESWTIADDDERWTVIADGLKKLVLREADEPDAPKPQKGEKVECDYSGFLRDGGSMFDSSRDRGDKFKFELGKGAVIKGWDEGIATMQIGEKCILRCSSEFAYGENGSPPNIPGGATLDFVVELHDVISFEEIWGIDDAPGTILKKMVKEERDQKFHGYQTPKEMMEIVASVTGRENDAKGRVFFEDENYKFKIPFDMEFNGKGICDEFPHPRGFYKAITTCNPGNLMHFKMKCTEVYTYGKTGNEKFGIKPGTDLFYEITLKELGTLKSAWQLEPEEKLPRAKELKEIANGYFRKKKGLVAKKIYTDCLDITKGISEPKEEDAKEIQAINVACHSNIALICVQNDDLSEAMKSVNEGLKLDPNHVKLRFRLAQVHHLKFEFEECDKILTTILQDAPETKGVKNLLAKNKAQQKKAAAKQRKLAKKMFGGAFSKSKPSAEASKEKADPAKDPSSDKAAPADVPPADAKAAKATEE